MLHALIEPANDTVAPEMPEVEEHREAFEEIRLLGHVAIDMLNDAKHSFLKLVPASAHWGDFEQIETVIRAMRRAAADGAAALAKR